MRRSLQSEVKKAHSGRNNRLRVQQRYDGVWNIFRKKLILPTATTEAPALPHWRRNSLQCSISAAHLLNSTHKATR
jgi:hypothetical protein